MLARSPMLALGLLLLAVASAADGQPYNNIFDAIMRDPQALRAKAMLTTMMTNGIPPNVVEQYQYIMPYVQDNTSTLTAFVPSNKAFEDLQLYMCMTVEELDNYMGAHPDLVMDLVQQTISNTTRPVFSRNFTNNRTLATFQPGFSIRLARQPRRVNTTSWVLPKFSYNSSDITILTTDVPAGKSVMHLIDGIVTSSDERDSFKNMSITLCSRPGAAAAAAASVGSAREAAARQVQAAAASGAPAGAPAAAAAGAPTAAAAAPAPAPQKAASAASSLSGLGLFAVTCVLLGSLMLL